jgi:hypothetical protein
MTQPMHTSPMIDAHIHAVQGSLEYLKEIMEANNLSRVVNLGVLETMGIPFEEGMHAFRRVLGERIVYFPSPDFSDVSPGFGERMADELERKVEGGARGLKNFKTLGLHCKDADGQLISVDDPRLDPLWARAGELDIPVLIHSSDVLAHFQPLDESNEQMEALRRFPDWHVFGDQFPDHDELLEQRNRVIARHPDTVFIGAHVGGYGENLAYVDAWLDRYANLYVDTSASIVQLGRHPTQEVQAFFIKHQDRILFGSDLVLGTFADEDEGEPWEFKRSGYDYGILRRFYETDDRQIKHPGYPVFGNWKVNAIKLPQDVLEKLYAGNAQRLIPGLRV